MQTNLILAKTEMFGAVQCDFYQNEKNEVFMTGEQLGGALGYAEPIKSISNLVNRNPQLDSPEFSVVIKLMSTDGKHYDTRVFTEDGIYEVTMLSKTEKATEFRSFARSVLKSIRKHGAYMTPETIEKALTNPDFIIGLATQLKEERAKVAALAPKAEYFDALVDRKLNINFRDTAKEFGIKQKEFLSWLMDNGFLYRDQHGKLKPYAQHVPALFVMKEWATERKSGTQTLVTPKGRETFRLLMGRGKLAC